MQRHGSDVANRARRLAMDKAKESGRSDLVDDAAIVVSELVTNAVLHGGGCTGVAAVATDDGLRIEVRDDSRVPPVIGHSSDGSLTGRGLRIVASLSYSWGAQVEGVGKVVWAEITGRGHSDFGDLPDDVLLGMWDDDWDWGGEEARIRVEIGDVSTDLLLGAKSHVDNVAREFALASAGAQAGLTAEVPSHLAALLRTVVERFAEARVAIKHQALEAARRGDATTHLTLELPLSAAGAAEEYLRALDEIDAYSRAMRLLTLESPPQHRAFRHWYIGELLEQLRAAEAGRTPSPPVTFERWLLAELDRMASMQRASQRAARLYAVAAALANAATPEAVAEAVLTEGVAALGASGGGILLSTDDDTLVVPGVVGYDDDIVARLRSESRDAELPAAVALRTGEAVWLESRADRDARFPELVGLEAGTVALCAVPLVVGDRRLGALRFSFADARLFDDDERQFVGALAAQTSQALDRAQLQLARLDASRRLQRSLLPPTLPEIPGLDVAALYHPFGDGMDVGGDFYDVWPIGQGLWAIAIGDVAGTGPEAAALTGLVRHTARALTLTTDDPEAIIRQLNTTLREAAGEESERFCTLILGIVSTDPLALRLAAGGHPSPVVRHADGTVETVTVGGSLLGVLDDITVGSVVIPLLAGQTVALMTDGILEARADGVMFDYRGVEQVLGSGPATAQVTTARLEAAVLAHIGGVPTDDMAALVLRVVG